MNLPDGVVRAVYVGKEEKQFQKLVLEAEQAARRLEDALTFLRGGNSMGYCEETSPPLYLPR